ncbi:hypothetical protein KL918_004921 [Ogataea parapolymorpha]|uniref:Indoleamine 2,3-dioxygenase n=1 Tax=Ogataea parapolymorpha (strain ATCC 26012 / BCRC 20466 / JCM 22074 / NRRL Y-7560 / DL-1) TaxID=871575 RepID=W1QGD1_OGAPD|nr:putative tryptophan 2,3-dioxygenase or indoleamine 2,3-dioxygenase [Ogataea parapolymorpha DL-1]ESX00135.1 putative tryptophan 2,3-dioxygenase or indoleamine 2,3-dioxygenase [Ogataea parapolymorpha DL-1]KAG7865045.1 hypothetical protein KL918_004921 [Ogataea parapolymorpha]KAG7872270.1 hypothetical protein KL916_003293 [Ogataea parapolymorpha]
MSYTYPLPDLAQYDVSEKTGFLPEEMPLESLGPYYEPWERLVRALPGLLLTKRIRAVVDALPLLSTVQLQTEAEFRRAHSVLGFLAHAYIWGVAEPTNRLPEQLAKPWIAVSEHLRLPPVATYADLCLWNFRYLLPDSDTDFLDNIQTISTFTGSFDESWFYLVSVYFEYKGASCLTTGLEAIKNAREGSSDRVVQCLQRLAEQIDYLGSVLMRMEEMCDPHVFYFRLRPYLAGWKNMKDAGLVNGVYYGNEAVPREYSGGSNAQSSLIQALDLLLNVEHRSTGEQAPSAGENPFMADMRRYMPGKHADFLAHLGKINILSDYVAKHAHENSELVLSYDACVAMLKCFRDKHIQIVTRYIVIQSQKARSMGSQTTSTLRAGLAKAKTPKKDIRGTGGTALLPFLKQCRDETGNAAAGNWGRRILSYKEKPAPSSSSETVGLAGQWTKGAGDGSAHW